MPMHVLSLEFCWVTFDIVFNYRNYLYILVLTSYQEDDSHIHYSLFWLYLLMQEFIASFKRRLHRFGEVRSQTRQCRVFYYAELEAWYANQIESCTWLRGHGKAERGRKKHLNSEQPLYLYSAHHWIIKHLFCFYRTEKWVKQGSIMQDLCTQES